MLPRAHECVEYCGYSRENSGVLIAAKTAHGDITITLTVTVLVIGALVMDGPN